MAHLSPTVGPLMSGSASAYAEESDKQDPEAVRRNNEAIELAQRRDFPAAVQSLRYARARDPRSEILKKNLQQVLLAWAAERIDARDWLHARDLLEEAYELVPDADSAYWLGRVWQKTGEEARVQGLWEGALQRSPQDARLLVSLGSLYEQQGFRAEALELFYRAEAHSPIPIDGLRGHIERLERELDAEWEYETQTTPWFHFRYPDSLPPSLAKELPALFERAREQVSRFLELESNERIDVVLYDARRFAHVTQAPGWAAGTFNGRIQLPLANLQAENSAAMERVARHEIAHALLSRPPLQIPVAWLGEGLAMHAEAMGSEEHAAWAQRLLRDHPQASLAELPPTFLSLSEEQARVAYALSYRAVQVLLDRFTMREILGLLHDDGQPFEARFQALTGQTLTEFARALH
jgi:tetratricopeptide (TPR) repeat protein